jgi:peroxiredoxin
VLIPTPVRLFAALAIVVAISACDSRSAAPPVGSGPQDGTDESVTVQLLREPLDVEPFTLTDLSGRQLSSADWKGKVVLVNFWATWCPPCLEEMPAMERLWRAHKDAGFVLVAVSVDTDPRKVAPFVTEHRLTFPVALDSTMSVANKYGVRALPSSFIVGKDGGLAGLALGPRAWDSDASHRLVRTMAR